MVPHNPLDRIPALYHFTDTRNLLSIRELGGLFSTAKLKEMGVRFYPGGNDWSLDADMRFGMDSYVHLCFATDHPMEHLARNDGRIQVPIYLKIDRDVMSLAGVRFAPGVSNASGMSLCSMDEAKGLIDYAVLYSYMPWSDPVIQARRSAAEKCEILVPDHLPIKYIRNMPNG